MLLLKVCGGTWESASRDIRELSVARELGADIEVVAKGEHTGTIDTVAGYKVNRVSTRPLGNHVSKRMNRIVALFVWANFVRKFDADIISGHDILGLSIGFMSNIGKKRKAQLVYDSHEFEIKKSAARGAMAAFMIMHLERFLMKKCAFTIMVNDSIADKVREIHKQESRAIVVRNIPTNWCIDKKEIEKTRKNVLETLGLDNETFIVMYHGALFRDRGIENMLKATAQLENVCAVILGNGEKQYIDELKKLCDELNIGKKVLFHKAVSHEELYKYVGAANVGAVILLPVVENHVFALPNKLFENIQSLTPVIVSNFPELGRLTDKYGIGLKVNPSNINEIADAIEKMRTNKQFYHKCKENLVVAKNELCWENEKRGLKEAYEKILH